MGKSAAAKLLIERGIAVVDTDVIAREVVEPGQPALGELAAEFGGSVIGPDGRLLRGKLAAMVFSDEATRSRLEAIMHPRIRAKWAGRVELWRAEDRPIAVVVIPLLFETNAAAHFDATVCVACTAGTQEERLKSRGWSLLQIEDRRRAQWPVERKMALSDYVVWSEGGLDLLNEQLARIIN